MFTQANCLVDKPKAYNNNKNNNSNNNHKNTYKKANKVMIGTTNAVRRRRRSVVRILRLVDWQYHLKGGGNSVCQNEDTIIIIIINVIYIAQFDTNGILTALYIVITYIQMQYVHV